MKLSGKRNINPNVWGPTFWDTLHFTAFGYPNNPNEIDKDSYKHFIIPIKGEMVDMLFTKTADCNIYYNTCFTTNHSVINNS